MIKVLTTREVGPSLRRYIEHEGIARQFPESYVVKFFSIRPEIEAQETMHTPNSRATTNVQASPWIERVTVVS